MKKTDPYADLGEVYAEETSTKRVAVKPTAKTPTLDEIEDATRTGQSQT